MCGIIKFVMIDLQRVYRTNSNSKVARLRYPGKPGIRFSWVFLLQIDRDKSLYVDNLLFLPQVRNPGPLEKNKKMMHKKDCELVKMIGSIRDMWLESEENISDDVVV